MVIAYHVLLYQWSPAGQRFDKIYNPFLSLDKFLMQKMNSWGIVCPFIWWLYLDFLHLCKYFRKFQSSRFPYGFQLTFVLVVLLQYTHLSLFTISSLLNLLILLYTVSLNNNIFHFPLQDRSPPPIPYYKLNFCGYSDDTHTKDL